MRAGSLLVLLSAGILHGTMSCRGGVTYFEGMCDASAVVPVDSRFQLVADDEDNRLRLFDLNQGGAAVWSAEYSRFLKVDPKEPEVDLEAAARVGDRVYWISSHGRSRKGAFRTSRHRFFATRIVMHQGQPQLEVEGTPYVDLLTDLLADPRFHSLGLETAARLAPKEKGGMNIEGLAALPDGRLLLGFRSPQPRGKALVVPLENPDELIHGRKPVFGDPILLDLEGRGIRGMGEHEDRIILLAGAGDAQQRPALFEWDLSEVKPIPVPGLGDQGFNPESVAIIGEEGDEAFLLVSDDGSVRIGKKECKRLKNPAQKHFRARILPLTPAG